MIKVNASNISYVKNEMVDQANKILMTLDSILKKINTSNEVFNTPASKYFQEQAVNLINLQKNEINNDLIPFINKLDDVVNTYNVYNDNVKKMVG